MKKAFIFDFDGTLGETIPLALTAIDKAFESVGRQAPSHQEIKNKFGPNELGLMQIFAPDIAEELFKKYIHYCEVLHPIYSPKPFDGIAQALQIIKENNANIGIVTGKCEESADVALKFYGIRDYFSSIKFGSIKGVVKPEKMREILEMWNIDLSTTEVYYVGDVVEDVKNSLEVGLIPLSAAWSNVVDLQALENSGTSKIFKSVAEFNDWLTALFAK